MYPNFYQDQFDSFLGPDCLGLGQETWRLFVDGKQQKNPTEKGWVAFERREPGCLHGMFQALAAQRKNINEDVSLGLICDIHKTCTEGTEKLQAQNKPGQVRSHQEEVTYTFMDEAVCGYEKPSAKQIADREQWTRDIEKEIHIVLSRENSLPIFIYSNEIVPEISSPITRVKTNIIGRSQVEPVAEYFINKYNTKIHQIMSDYLEDKKNYENHAVLNNAMRISEACLDEIINLVTVLERVHIFNDANGRTLCTILLNRELIKYGFSPVILDNPNMFDGCCHETMKAKIKEGMLRFQEIKAGKIPEDYIKTRDIVDHYSVEKTRHYYYDPLKVLTTSIALVRKLNNYMLDGDYTQASKVIDELLIPTVVLPENGDINIEAMEVLRSILNERLNIEGLDLKNKEEFKQKSSPATKGLYFYLRRYDALEKRMQESQQTSLTSSSPKSPKQG